jgi:hypothetical protein
MLQCSMLLSRQRQLYQSEFALATHYSINVRILCQTLLRHKRHMTPTHDHKSGWAKLFDALGDGQAGQIGSRRGGNTDNGRLIILNDSSNSLQTNLINAHIHDANPKAVWQQNSR